MQNAQFKARRDRARELMLQNGMAALLIGLPANRYYLSGFELHDPQPNESSGYLAILENGEDMLFTDARYLEAAKRLWKDSNIHIYRTLSAAPGEINQRIKERAGKSAKVGFESRLMSVAFHREFCPGLDLVAADGLVEKLRLIKDAAEIELMRKSAQLNHQLMNHVPSLLKPGRTEAQIAWEIEQFFRNNGASGNAFEPIVAVGPNAALPHAIPGNSQIVQECSVLVDVGARLADYNSDQTRSFWVGEHPARYFTVALEQIQEAQRRSIAAIKPGAICADVYHAAYNYLADCGVAEHFTHGLGHGVGLETHEAPSLSPRNPQPLAPGMIVTVEPGLYYPEWGGVRWEYMVLVTENGCEIL